MPRTVITTTKLTASTYGIGADIADPAGTTIDSTLVTNGISLAVAKTRKAALRVSNTSGTGKQLVFKRPTSSQDTAIGDLTTTAIAATTGVRVFTVPSGFQQSDGTVNIDLQAGHTGAFQAFELP